MKLLKNILFFIEILIIMNFIILPYNSKEVYAQQQIPVRVGVLLYRFDDVYISLVRQGLEDIQKNNESKVQFTFYDCKNDQSIQNATINTLLTNKSVDLLLLNLVDVNSAYNVIDIIKEYDIPVVLFNREPNNMDAVQSYGKSYFVGTDASQAGVLQGKIIIDTWNKNKTTIDLDGDNTLQYIMLMGESENKEATNRTQFSVSTVNNAGIQTQELALSVCDWNRDVARQNFEELFLHYGNDIEIIISNNDEMAIGAIEVLQKYGYNMGEGGKTIPVVGVDAIPEAQELIKKGEMTGSVLQDAPAMAKACYTIGINLVNGKQPLDGTSYTADDTGVAVRIPYKEYKG